MIHNIGIYYRLFFLYDIEYMIHESSKDGMDPRRPRGFYGILWDFMGFYGILWDVPSSNLLTAKITIEIVDISMNNGDFPQLS